MDKKGPETAFFGGEHRFKSARVKDVKVIWRFLHAQRCLVKKSIKSTQSDSLPSMTSAWRGSKSSEESYATKWGDNTRHIYSFCCRHRFTSEEAPALFQSACCFWRRLSAADSFAADSSRTKFQSGETLARRRCAIFGARGVIIQNKSGIAKSRDGTLWGTSQKQLAASNLTFRTSTTVFTCKRELTVEGI